LTTVAQRPHLASLAALGAAVAACASLDPAGPLVTDVTGQYAGVMAIHIANEFETRDDTLRAVVSLQGNMLPDRRVFVGQYTIAPSDSGGFDGEFRTDSTFLLTEFGHPPKLIAGVPSIRELYPWCDFTLLGLQPAYGGVRGDSLNAAMQGSLPCSYHLEGGFVLVTSTALTLSVVAVR